jgi:hypothetical protein
VPRNDGWKSANDTAGKVCLQASVAAVGRNREHRRDAYDTMGLGDVRDAEAERKVA